jgi:U3 small nucleolar RNA-associated protein MPP10
MLAPEEIYERSSADLRMRGELSPREKRTAWSKVKKARKKTRRALDNNVNKFAKTRGVGGIKAQKSAALQNLVKSGKGVTVVGKLKQNGAEREKRTKAR